MPIKPKPKTLIATHLVALQHSDGGVSLAMINNKGAIYLHSDRGWVALPMIEAVGETDNVTAV